VIIDVGAGNGVDTVLFSRLAGASGRVLAVEAHPKTIRLLRATCFHNKLSNVTIVHNAVMDSIRRVGISDLSNHLANHVQIENDMEGHQIVDTTTMDALCDKYDISTIDLMKMNIEGAETHAIKGMTTTIAKVHHACIACHDFIQPNPDGRITRAVTTFMTSNGFDVRDRKTDERPWVREHLYFERRPSHVKDADMSHVY
jgi:FkbM family methyltransferase